jgi:16S rRNA (cytosine1402-N4)-methyltransferase
MRMDPDARLTAADVVNTYSQEELERILRAYGEEPNARRIARAIVAKRRHAPLRTTGELAEVVIDATPPAGRRRGYPPRRTFQAVRIEVNAELESLEGLLRSVSTSLRPGGRIIVLSYHSLEDRLVKRTLADLAEPAPALPGLPAPVDVEPEVKILTRGAVLPTPLEIERNPRASSARLRAAERLEETA